MIEKVGQNAPSFHYIQDQLGNKEVWKTNNLEIPDLSFKDMLQAKLRVDGGQNVFTPTQNDKLPRFLQIQLGRGTKVNTEI